MPRPDFRSALAVVLLSCLWSAAPARAQSVVINEVFYNAPDDLDKVQWIELYNPGDKPVDLSGWTIDQGKVLTVPAGVSLAAKGFAVVALDREAFATAYGDSVSPVATLKRALKRGSERLELRDGHDTVVDTIRYQDEAPWPVSADGYSASLERICPGAGGVEADNWAGSPLPTTPRPAGTPGKTNTAYSAALPPVVSPIPETALVPPGKPLAVSAQISAAEPLKSVTLLYRVVVAGVAAAEIEVPMSKGADGAWTGSVPAQSAGALLRYRVRVTSQSGARRFWPAENDLRPTLSTYVRGPFAPAPLARGIVLAGGTDRRRSGGSRYDEGPEPPHPPRGASTFVYVEPQSDKVTVFDHINAVPRTSQRDTGFILHFHKDRPLAGQSAVSLFDEGNPRWLLSEALAYDLYRRAGNAAPRTEFVRVSVNGKASRPLLMVERPNKSFLRRNKIDASGNLYKIRWYGDGLVGKHEKKTNVQTDHEDLKETIAELTATRGSADAQWAIIQKRFDVNQVATHWAVNMVLSHWDGYFNNYFAYHDLKTDRWLLFPWDHDKAWGYDDDEGALLTNLPLSFGKDGGEWDGPAPGLPIWWRPGGAFSVPLLNNPHFRKVYHARIRAILDTLFTQEIYFPIIDSMVASLGEDAPAFAAHTKSFKTFLTQRRAYLLAQAELR